MTFIRAARRSPFPFIFALSATLAAGFFIWLWTFSPLAEKMDVDLLLTAADILRGTQFAHLLLIGMYILASVVVFPFSILDAFTIIVFGPVHGAMYAYILSSFCAMWMFVLVRHFRKRPARIPKKVFPAQWTHVLNQPGMASVMMARNLPIAFSINNVMFALSSVRTRDYVIGSMIGNLFPVLFLSVIFSQTRKAILEPSTWQFACLVLVLLSVMAIHRLFRKRVSSRADPE